MKNNGNLDIKNILQSNIMELLKNISNMGLLNAWVIKFTELIDDYKVRKDYKPQDIKEIFLPPELKMQSFVLDPVNIANKKLKEEVDNFINVMTINFPKNTMKNFYNNINNLKILITSPPVLKKAKTTRAAGVYYTIRNIIKIENNINSSIFYHELLHMASSFYKNNIVFTGFCQNTKKTSVGRGITEGYTDLLVKRYFCENVKSANSYRYETGVCKMLELIIGKSKMEYLYFNSNLYGLVQELKLYSTENEIIKFISCTDFIEKHWYNKSSSDNKHKEINTCFKNINAFLLNAYSRKELLEMEKGKITQEQLKNNIISFINMLPKSIKIRDKIYQLSNEDDIRKVLEIGLKTNEEKSINELDNVDVVLK